MPESNRKDPDNDPQQDPTGDPAAEPTRHAAEESADESAKDGAKAPEGDSTEESGTPAAGKTPREDGGTPERQAPLDGDPPDPKLPRGNMEPSPHSRWIIWLILVIVIVSLVSLAQTGRGGRLRSKDYAWSDFIQDVKKGLIKSMRAEGQFYSGEYVEPVGGLLEQLAKEQGLPPGDKKPYKRYEVEGPPWESLSDKEKDLIESSEKIKKREHPKPSAFLPILLSYLPLLLIVGILWFIFIRHMRSAGGPGGVLSFGRSRASLIQKEKIKKTFNDVAGIEEAKEEVEEITDFLREPRKYQKLGGRIPRGVLLIGAPGTGKTLLAKAIAGEADVPFYSISGSDFVEMFVGVGASRVRDLFTQARDNSPCIIFLDEIDAVGRRRGAGLGGGHDEREQTLNAILVEMDGFDSDEKIIVMAATNRPDVLDPALLRPGRFDRHIYVEAPDIRGRAAILRVHAKRVKLAPEVDLQTIAKATPGFNGAQLENLINEAALLAVKRDKSSIETDDLEEARDKVLWGREKRSRVISEADRWVIAYHESGHALVGYLLEEVDRPHKVTIIPRGPSLGSTSFLPEKDVYNVTRRRLLGEITVLLAGRIAERMFCDDLSTGAKNDIERATEIAHHMVCEWGMSEKLGPINYSPEEEHLFLGREVTRTQGYSQMTSELIDREMKRIVDESDEEATRILHEHREDAERIAAALIEHEVLSAANLENIMSGRPVEDERHKKASDNRSDAQESSDAVGKSDGDDESGVSSAAEEGADADPSDERPSQSPSLETAGDQSGSTRS